MIPDEGFPRLREAAAASWLALAVGSAVAAIGHAWADSRLGRAGVDAWMRANALPLTMRIRFVALTLAWAGAGHLVLAWLGPVYVAPGLPWGFVAGGAAIAAAVGLAAEPVARAWRESALAGLLVRSGPRN